MQRPRPEVGHSLSTQFGWCQQIFPGAWLLVVPHSPLPRGGPWGLLLLGEGVVSNLTLAVRGKGSRVSPPPSLYPHQQLGSCEVQFRNLSPRITPRKLLFPSFKLTLVKSQWPG